MYASIIEMPETTGNAAKKLEGMFKLRHEVLCDVVLNVEDVGKFSIVPFGPKLASIHDIHELYIQPQAVASPLDATLYNVANA